MSVDVIARRARLNKAMVYYHFGSKKNLYQEVLRDTFRTVAARLRAVADAPINPPEKLGRFVATFADEITGRPLFPAIMLREVVDRGAHLDAESIRQMLVIPLTFAEVLGEGVAAGIFRPVDPLLAYFSVLAPIAMFTASGPMRRAAASKTGLELPAPDGAQLATHLQRLVLAMLEMPPRTAGAAVPGDHP